MKIMRNHLKGQYDIESRKRSLRNGAGLHTVIVNLTVIFNFPCPACCAFASELRRA